MSLEVVRIPEGETGLISNVSEEKAELIASLVASGTLDERAIGKDVGLTVMTVRKALRSPRIQALVRAEIQARATLLMPNALQSAALDMGHSDSKARAQGRDFIRKTAEGKDEIVQNNVTQVWSPEKDEALFEQGRKLFERMEAPPDPA